MAPSTATPNQLTDGDALFLSMETETAGGHVGAVMLLEIDRSDPHLFRPLGHLDGGPIAERFVGGGLGEAGHVEAECALDCHGESTNSKARGPASARG